MVDLFFAADFVRPHIDWHAVAPELTLVALSSALTLLDLILLERGKRLSSTLTGLAFLVALIPVLTLALDGNDRYLWDGAFVVDNLALVLKALFLLSGYVVVLISANYIAEGDYWESEYYTMLSSSVLGMLVMASARDLISIFVALELLSIPAYLMAAWRKRDLKSNEAGLKYYLMGVFASAIMLYGMSLLFGITGSTQLSDIGARVSGDLTAEPIVTLGIIFVIVGFAFKVSAVPFHTWAPDTYEGAPTPVTAFLAVSAKTAGFVALIQLIFVGFLGRSDVVEPLMWVFAAASMTVGNLIALRQTNVVRILAYSGVAQAGFIMAPFAVVGTNAPEALSAIVSYLIIYAAMNLGAFAVVIAVARKTRSAELDSFGGVINFAPALVVAMGFFLFSLAGIPPFGGWFAKFMLFWAVVSAGSTAAIVLGAIMAINSVLALFYYAKIMSRMVFDPAPDGDHAPIDVPPALNAALVLCAAATLAIGVYPQLVGQLTDFGGSFNFALGG